MNTFVSKFIGDRKFYRSALTIALPIMLQNAVTNFVSLLDNIMVGQTGLESMAAVSVVNQLMFVFNLMIFGVCSGPGIFCAQYYGAGNKQRLKSAFQLKLIAACIVGAVGIAVLYLLDEQLIGRYLNDTGDGADPVLVMRHAKNYLAIMLLGLPAFALSSTYSSTLREVGRTGVPMIASMTAVMVNLVGNWLLIFGHLGFPELGVSGAAIATVISRYVEVLILLIWSHRHSAEVVFTEGVFKQLNIPKDLALAIIKKSTPLFTNEVLWSVGQAFLIQLYSLRGLSVVAALNITSVFTGLCDVVCFSIGNTIGIMIGQLLGAGKLEEAVDADRKLLTFIMMVCVGVVIVMLLLSGWFPTMYNVDDSVRQLASELIRVCAITLPLVLLPHGLYFTLRSGGKTFITFLFDAGFSWAVNIPVVYCLAHFTALPIVSIYFISLSLAIVKCVLGLILVIKRVWVVDLTHQYGG